MKLSLAWLEISMAAALALATATAGAQQSGRVVRIGQLTSGPADCEALPLGRYPLDLRRGLHDLGWVEGRDFQIERRCYADVEQLPALARQIVGSNPDVIVVWTSPATRVLKQLTGTIPIVSVDGALEGYRAGLLSSFPLPGGNLTGGSNMEDVLIAKRFEMMHDILPQARNAAFLAVSGDPLAEYWLKLAKSAARKLGLALHRFDMNDPSRLGQSFAEMHAAGAEFLVTQPGGSLWPLRQELAALALAYKLPTIYSLADHVQAGGLISYAAETSKLSYRAAAILDRVMRGHDPADIPVEQASEFILAVNLRTAKQVGINLPATILARADEVIE